MHRHIAFVGVVVLLLGLLVGLPGTALQEDKQALAPQSESAPLEEEGTPEAFLEVLAGKLGISVERLEQLLRETKNELIEEWVDKWAEELKEQLTQAEPPQLLQRLTRKQVGQSLKEQLRRLTQAGKQLVSPTPQEQLPSYAPPYYWPSPCNCVCYCYPNYYMPVPLQPQQVWPQPWPWFQLPVPEVTPQPEEK